MWAFKFRLLDSRSLFVFDSLSCITKLIQATLHTFRRCKPTRDKLDMSCSSMQLLHRGVGKKKSAYPGYTLQDLSPHGVASGCLPQSAAPCSSGCCHADSAGCSPLPQSLLRNIARLSGSKHREVLQPSKPRVHARNSRCCSMHAERLAYTGLQELEQGLLHACFVIRKTSRLCAVLGPELADWGPMVRFWAPGQSPCRATASPPAGSPHVSCPGQAPGRGAQRPGRAGRAAL